MRYLFSERHRTLLKYALLALVCNDIIPFWIVTCNFYCEKLYPFTISCINWHRDWDTTPLFFWGTLLQMHCLSSDMCIAMILSKVSVKATKTALITRRFVCTAASWLDYILATSVSPDASSSQSVMSLEWKNCIKVLSSIHHLTLSVLL